MGFVYGNWSEKHRGWRSIVYSFFPFGVLRPSSKFKHNRHSSNRLGTWLSSYPDRLDLPSWSLGIWVSEFYSPVGRSSGRLLKSPVKYFDRNIEFGRMDKAGNLPFIQISEQNQIRYCIRWKVREEYIVDLSSLYIYSNKKFKLNLFILVSKFCKS